MIQRSLLVVFVDLRLRKLLLFSLLITLSSIINDGVQASSPGLPFTKDFSSTALRDSTKTNATWTDKEQELFLAWYKAQYGAFYAI